MKSDYFIPTVTNNAEKGESYKTNFQKFNKAKNEQFFFECMWILYAMLEDRTSAFLYYLGFTRNQKWSSPTSKKAIKREIRDIFRMSNNDNKYRFDSFGGKLDRIRYLLVWAETEENADTPYKQSVRSAAASLPNLDELKVRVAYLQKEWRDKRNQLIHALLNKSPDFVRNDMQNLIENGYKAVRAIDASVKQIQKKNIRTKFKIL